VIAGRGAPPADLLSVGVVETSRPAPPPVTHESVPDLPMTGEDALSETEPKPRSTRKRATAGEDDKPRRGRKSATAGDGEKAAPRRAARKSRSKTASD
jgi:hypothetical protein